LLTHHKEGKEPISAKKFMAGDGNFDTKKEMIGFVFNRVKRTVHQPPAKAAAYIKKTTYLAPLEDGSVKEAANAGRKAPACIDHPPRSKRLLLPP